MKRMFWIWILVVTYALPLESAINRKLLILSIDGCRPDALLKADAPNLRALADSGLYTWFALSRPPTKSGPCWSSIFTGVWNDKHGVTDNTFANSRFDLYPMLFQRVKNEYPSFYSGWFVYWPNLATDMPHGADVVGGDWSDVSTLQRAISFLGEEQADALFVHFGAADAVGHVSGFDTESPDYINAVNSADGQIGQVLSALESRPNYYNEHWMIIALTDHGGYATHHGGTMIGEMRTFFIISGDNVPRGEIPHDWMTKSYQVPPYGLQLNGSGDYVTIPDRADYHFGSSQDFTVELCISTGGWSGTPVLFTNKDLSSKKNPGFALLLIDEGKWQVNVADGTNEKDISGPVIADDHWHHLAAVFRRSGAPKGALTLFQDGIKTGAVDISGIGSLDTPYGFVLGQDGTDSRSAFVPGSISEVRVWKTALADNQIQNWIFTPVTPDHPGYSDLLGYWKMDDGQGTVIKDSSQPSNDGAFSGTTPGWIFPDDTVETLVFDSCRSAKNVDLTATALAHFGIEVQAEWNLDGKNLVPANPPDAVRESSVPPVFPMLLENYPNPFNPRTMIRFQIPNSNFVTLEIFNILGRKAAILVQENFNAGTHTSEWNAAGFASGVYLCRLQIGTFVQVRKIVLLR